MWSWPGHSCGCIQLGAPSMGWCTGWLHFDAWCLTEGLEYLWLTGPLPLSLSLWDLSWPELLYMAAGSQEGEQRLQGLLGAGKSQCLFHCILLIKTDQSQPRFKRRGNNLTYCQSRLKELVEAILWQSTTSVNNTVKQTCLCAPTLSFQLEPKSLIVPSTLTCWA